ncbi:MAG TPA: type I 3-dehydroquinate dehydratase, partial [Acidimicrobiales bacterium]|nr:type I 3-dehydroquinate dehydratase [Acidimicrobiales bacterium]
NGAIRNLFEADAPCVAVSFADDATDDEIAAATAAGMDIAEIRIDLFAADGVDHVVERVRRFGGVPTIATIRATAEGGAWVGEDARRLALYEEVVRLVGAVDVEASSTAICDRVIAAAHALGRLAIVSFHDFERTPPEAELVATIAQARDGAADVVKIATMAHDSDDLRTLARVLAHDHGVGLVVIGMGEAGAASRLLFPFLGSMLTFASAGRSTAPGQLPLAQMAATFTSLSSEYAARRH